jgi:N-formylmaleamate deformylase
MKYLAPILTGFLSVASAAAAQSTHPSFDVSVTGRGPAMVLIPGLLSSGEVWKDTVERYKDRYTLHTVTLAGFGGPQPIGAPFLSRVRDELIGYIRGEKLQKPIVIGHSLGGFMAFWIGASAPDLIGGIIAVDGVPFLPALSNPAASAEMMAVPAAQIAKMYESFTPEQLAAQSRPALASMITTPANVERAMTWVAKSDARTAGIAVSEMMTTDLRKDVGRITVPTLLIGASGAAPEAMREMMARAYAGQVASVPPARVKMATTARHFIMLDDPAFLFAAIDEFLASLPAR